MKTSHGVSGRGGVALAVLFTVGATVAMQAQSARNDGITVHGHWTIDVQNADGTVASHSDFENALEANGAAALANLLGKQANTASWRLDLIGANESGACVRASGGQTGEPTIRFVPPQTLDPQGPYIPAPFVNVDGFAILPTPIFDPSVIVTDPLAPPPYTLEFTVTAGSAPPGFVPGNINYDQNPAGTAPSWSHTFVWNPNPATGVYDFDLRIANLSAASNTYHVTLNVPASDPINQTPFPCSAVEAGTSIPSDLASAWFPNLELAIVDAGGGRQNLELQGHVTAASAEVIEQVRSVINLSTSAVLPFSSRVLQTPIPVVAGQIVYVKVVFSFS